MTPEPKPPATPTEVEGLIERLRERAARIYRNFWKADGRTIPTCVVPSELLCEAADALTRLTAERDEALKPKRDAMIERSEADWEKLEDAIGTLWGLEPGHVLTKADVDGLRHMDTCHRNDEEVATDAYHRGYEEGLRERGGEELVAREKWLSERETRAATDRAMRKLAEARAQTAEAELARCRVTLENLAGEARRIGPQLPYNAPTASLSAAIEAAEALSTLT